VTRSLIACFAALAALSAYATGLGLKPGLWEVRVVKQVVDGRSNGMTTVGKGESTAAGDLITNRSDVTMTRLNNPPRVIHNESE
jgi:hypothetical protein